MPEPTCVVCGIDVIIPQDFNKASWGPITVYFHLNCLDTYHNRVAPRLRDALLNALDRWKQRS